ncbi:relaxase/mobilization nuclease domain-containing protein [Pseudophaeobacter sp. 1A09344]|uniref:relaxase/mobilization nuclease domain-containing protein n=1 Tax=Pseudophaeobacter sp. 1A09344 TaxID=3098144 RepID=UPI0034D39CC5
MIGNPYKGRGFKGLLRYLHEGRKGEENPHRVIWSEARNLPTISPMVVAGIMGATAALSHRVKKPVFHLPISWPPDEQPPKDVQMQVAETLLADLGLSEHQHLIVAHDDGDCPHIHVVVNTVHPETGRAWNAWRDVYRIMESLERQEQELGLRIVDRPDLEELRSGERDLNREKGPSREEKKRAEREGDAPLSKWSEAMMRNVRKNITHHFKEATSWAELEARLEGQGLHLRRAGQGFRITDGEHFMTLSKIGKHARQDRLENRFQESWEGYEIDRDIDRDVADQLEPPESERPESILEELEQGAERQEAQAKAETSARIKHALSAASSYAYFRSKEKEAAELGAKLVRDQRALRQNKFVAERINDDIENADGDVDAACVQLYRNPRAARKELERRLKSGESLSEIDLSDIGKKRGWRLLGFRTKARKEANQALSSLPRFQKNLSRLLGQKDGHDHDGLTLQAKIGASEEAFNRAREVVGPREVRNERRLELWQEMRVALSQVSERDIWEANLPEEAREHLAAAWGQVVESDRKADRTRMQREMQRETDERLER